MPSHPHFVWTDLFRRRTSAQKALAHVMKSNILFETLSPQELNYLAERVYQRVYHPGEPIFKQNDRGMGVYIITQGQVAIKNNSVDGELLVTLLSEGSFFGEIALVEPENIRTASAVSVDSSVLIGFFKPDLVEILERRPTLGIKILFQLCTVLGRRLTETTERMSQLKRTDEKIKLNDKAA